MDSKSKKIIVYQIKSIDEGSDFYYTLVFSLLFIIIQLVFLIFYIYEIVQNAKYKQIDYFYGGISLITIWGLVTAIIVMISTFTPLDYFRYNWDSFFWYFYITRILYSIMIGGYASACLAWIIQGDLERFAIYFLFMDFCVFTLKFTIFNLMMTFLFNLYNHPVVPQNKSQITDEEKGNFVNYF